MMRFFAFCLSLLLLAGVVDPVQGWLITLTVLTGLAAVRFKFWAPLTLRPAFDFRLGAFVLATLLLAGAVDPAQDWLIALSIVTGIACFMPTIISLEPRYRPRARWNGEAW